MKADPDEPTWRDDAACLEVGTEAFYADPGEDHLTRAAKVVCRACTVTTECLNDALAHDERFGVWGATTPRERARIQRAQR